MKKILLSILLISVLMVSFASAAWYDSFRGKGVTGNVVNNVEYNDSLICQDADGGTFSATASEVVYKDIWGNQKGKSDVCNQNGKVVTEYYCNPKSGKISSVAIPCSGGCENGACKEDFCKVINSKTVMNQSGRFTNGCVGDSFVSYSCNEDKTAILPDPQICVGSCTPKGCVGNCTTLGEGNIVMDGKPLKNNCGTGDLRGTLSQYSCNGTALVKERVSCGKNRECVKDSNGIGSCRDIIAGTATVGDLNSQIASLSEEIAQLSADIAALNLRVTALEPSA